LSNLLQLKHDDNDDNGGHSDEENLYMTDHKIIEYATQHDLAIFISIDGSLNEQNGASTTITILAPDIRDYDDRDDTEWQDREAKILLIRSWCLPKKWGSGQACINMAETLGFILGEYTLPSHLPAIYITDSNNARTLQRNIKNIDDFTHRKRIRKIKQGIDYSIANHLEYLTKKWPQRDHQNYHTRRLYERGEEFVSCGHYIRIR